jgi:hypothetical protein
MENPRIFTSPEEDAYLLLAAEYGLATRELVRALRPHWTRGQVNYHAREGLVDRGLMDVYEKVAQPGRTGSPPDVYTLTPLGVKVCKRMQVEAAPLYLTGAALSHRLFQVHIAVKAKVNNLPHEIEKVLVFRRAGQTDDEESNGVSLRADVLVEVEQGSQLIEVEQEINPKNISRAVEKFLDLGRIYATRTDLTLCPNVLIVFGLSKADLPAALEVWSDALGKARFEGISFGVHYCTLADFLKNPSFEDVSVFPKLEADPDVKPMRKRQPSRKQEEEISLEGLCPPLDLCQHGNDLLDAWPIRIDENAEEQLKQFIHLAFRFYEPDFGTAGQTKLYGAKPVNSIGSLRSFLHDPRHGPLLALMKNQVAHFRKQIGVTTQMTAGVEMAWAFMGAFGLSAGGPLGVVLSTPQVGGNDQFEFKVLTSKEVIGDEPKAAIVWLLSTFVHFPRELGLLVEKQRRSRK